MNINHIEIDSGFNVIGITVRTTNQEAMNDRTIQKLWQQFFSDSAFSKIPNKTDNAIIALYYDFESDKNGHYTLLLGARVSSVEEVPTGMIAQQVLMQKRATFLSEVGPAGQVCFEMWKKIWTLEDEGKLNRMYISDYELYDERAQDSQKALVAIHIGVK